MKRIPAFRLHPEPLTEEAANLQKFEWNKDYVYRHKLGGEPEFIQSEDWPACSDCGQKMTFYAQLDSINDEFVISDWDDLRVRLPGMRHGRSSSTVVLRYQNLSLDF